MADLRIIGMNSEFQDPHVSKHLAAVESAYGQQSTVIDHRTVVAPSARRKSMHASLIPLHRHQIQQQDIVGVFIAVVTAYHKEIAPYYRRGVGEASMRDGYTDRLPVLGIDIVDPDVVEAFPSVRTAKDDEFAAHHVGGVVAPGLRFEAFFVIASA